MAFVEYFSFQRNLKTMLAVVTRIILDLEQSFLVCDKPQHLLRIAGEDESYTLVAVDCILEKSLIFLAAQNTYVWLGLQIFVVTANKIPCTSCHM